MIQLFLFVALHACLSGLGKVRFVPVISGKIPEKYILIWTETSSQPYLEVLGMYFSGTLLDVTGTNLTFPDPDKHD